MSCLADKRKKMRNTTYSSNQQDDYFAPPSGMYDNNGGGGNYDDDYAHDQHDSSQSDGCVTWQSCIYMIFFLLCFFFVSLVTYSLISCNTDNIKNLCPDLIAYMLLRTVLGSCVFVSMFTYNLCGTKEVWSYTTKQLVMVFFLLYFVGLAIYGAVVISKNTIGNSACTNAIYDNNFQAPLLGDLGWVYVVFDILYALGTIFFLYYQNLFWFTPINNNNTYYDSQDYNS